LSTKRRIEVQVDARASRNVTASMTALTEIVIVHLPTACLSIAVASGPFTGVASLRDLDPRLMAHTRLNKTGKPTMTRLEGGIQRECDGKNVLSVRS